MIDPEREQRETVDELSMEEARKGLRQSRRYHDEQCELYGPGQADNSGDMDGGWGEERPAQSRSYALIFLAAPVAALLEIFLHQFFCAGWLLFDPLLALALIYAFLHYLETRNFLLYAFWCGLWKDAFSVGAFGVFAAVFVSCALLAAFASRMVYRRNWLFIFPLVFLGQFVSNHIAFFLDLLLPLGRHFSYSFSFFGRTLLEAFGTSVFAYPVFIFLGGNRRCDQESTL